MYPTAPTPLKATKGYMQWGERVLVYPCMAIEQALANEAYNGATNKNAVQKYGCITVTSGKNLCEWLHWDSVDREEHEHPT